MTDLGPLTSTSAASTILDDVDPTPLFTPYRLGGVELANRFVMAPMTRQHSPGGVPTAAVAEYYRRRAEHFGLIVTEGTYIDHPSAGDSDSVPRMHGAHAEAGWKTVVDAVHGAGGRIFPQLWHLGLARTEGMPPVPDAPALTPSGVDRDGTFPRGRVATAKDIDEVIASFARAAATAQRIGFDGVELHGAHGYLLDSFLWSTTNHRDDAYGGSITERARLSAEVINAVRGEVGADFPVVFRYSQWKGGHFDAQLATDPAELEALLTPLVTAGVSGFHVSTRRYWQPAFAGSPTTLAGWTKVITGSPTVAIGSVGVPLAYGERDQAARTLSIAPLIDLFERGEFDLVALGRAALSESDWPLKLRQARLDEIRLYEKSHESTLN